MKCNGITATMAELSIFYHFTHTIRQLQPNLQNIPIVCYYWITFTIMTGIWEFTFIRHRKKVQKISETLLITNTHVWTNKYPLSIILPWNFSKRFYAEYGAYADREYKTITDNWSYLIEGTHAVFCGLMGLCGIIATIYNSHSAIPYITLSMGSQLMNSILYLGEYNIQTKDKNNNNYNRHAFPLGRLWSKRPFMYVNIFWTIMPLYILINIIS